MHRVLERVLGFISGVPLSHRIQLVAIQLKGVRVIPQKLSLDRPRVREVTQAPGMGPRVAPGSTPGTAASVSPLFANTHL